VTAANTDSTDDAAAALGRLVAAVRARDRLRRPWRGTRRGTELLALAAARQVSTRVIRIRIRDAYAAGATIEQITAASGHRSRAVRTALLDVPEPRP